ncbi:class II aaRS and biotin synthetase [Wallemia mellicola]|uniref:Class II aaRS and biotin synthetase n=1 Tax=Wallemia mellicola TaxID=1708541 RepID=A0A4T0QZR9_9BASI|nr:class II aaRS and biotin synthetase [Wallemia mellicola]
MNVLIYDGPGTSPTSVRRLQQEMVTNLVDKYSIQLVSPEILANEPWEEHTRAIVIPGGRDLPYLQCLNGKATRKIKEYVNNGGKYFGVCAGAYFACRSIEFAKNDPQLAIIGDRPLKFVDGVAVGPTFDGFEYNSENGAHLVQLNYNDGSSGGCYLNGGCSFNVDPAKGEVLARYAHDGSIAAYHIGDVVVTGLHPEFSIRALPASMLVVNEDPKSVAKMEQARINHFRKLLGALKLELSPIEESKPKGLLPLVLTSSNAATLTTFVEDLTDKADISEEPKPFNNESGNDSIVLHSSGGYTLRAECDRIAHAHQDPDIDFNKITKHIYVFDQANGIPTSKFNIAAYLSELRSEYVGRLLLYGEAVTSTQTMLDKWVITSHNAFYLTLHRNTQLLKKCPDGLLALASHQLAGRGRGKNAWVSSSGCLQFSLVLRLDASKAAYVVFVQYLVGLAIIQALKSHTKDLDISLKWPNDIYALKDGKLLKIGGILINSQFIDGQFVLVVGAGVNINNSHPTTCINDLLKDKISIETAMALIAGRLEKMWSVFSRTGFGEYLDDYYEAWLHSDQEITIEDTKQMVRVAGITLDHGYLRTYPDMRCKRTPRDQLYQPVDLQPDGNSFDMLAGLIKVKK